jgi:uncharacterized protein (TIGR02147 family)
MSNIHSVPSILNKAFLTKKKDRAGFSLRSCAKVLGCSPAFLSRVLSGKSPLPVAKVDLYSEVFGLDQFAKQSLQEALASSTLQRKNLSVIHSPQTQKLSESYRDYEIVLSPAHQEAVLRHWYHLAILDLMLCSNFVSDSKWIAQELGLTAYEVDCSLRLLEDVGLASQESGRWIKKHEKIHFTTRSSTSVVRNYQKQNLARAIQKMVDNTALTDYENRLIASASIAVNSSQIPAAKQILMKAIADCLEVLSTGECDQVFNVSVALFSQHASSKPSSKK